MLGRSSLRNGFGIFAMAAALLLVAYRSASAGVVYTTDFSTGGVNPFRSSGALGASTPWNASITTGDGGARIRNGVLELTSNADGTSTGNGIGVVRAFIDTTTAYTGAGYSARLDQSTGIVEWSFNMRQSYSDPAYPTAGYFGVAFVLASNNASYDTTGNGYAVVLGNNTDTPGGEPIRLIRFTGGLAATGGTNRKALITASTVLNSISTEHMSILVRLDPATNTWTLLGRNDSGTAVDPKAGSLTTLGTGTDDSNTHTDISLPYAGALFAYGSGGPTAVFDNFTVAVVPEPVTLGLVGLCSVVGLMRRR